MNEKVNQGHLTESFWSGREILCVALSMSSIKNDGGVAAFLSPLLIKSLRKKTFNPLFDERLNC